MVNIDRGSNNAFLSCRKDNKIIKIDKEKFYKKHKIHSIIRFHLEEFLKIHENNFTHFNLQHTIHKKGKFYALVKIIKPGYFTKDQEIPPLLDLNNFLIAKCIEVKNNLRYEDLTNEDFKNSFHHIKSVRQLKKAIVKRYSKSMPNLSKEKIISLGIAITKLKIIKEKK